MRWRIGKYLRARRSARVRRARRGRRRNLRLTASNQIQTLKIWTTMRLTTQGVEATKESRAKVSLKNHPLVSYTKDIAENSGKLILAKRSEEAKTGSKGTG